MRKYAAAAAAVPSPLALRVCAEEVPAWEAAEAGVSECGCADTAMPIPPPPPLLPGDDAMDAADDVAMSERELAEPPNDAPVGVTEPPPGPSLAVVSEPRKVARTAAVVVGGPPAAAPSRRLKPIVGVGLPLLPLLPGATPLDGGQPMPPVTAAPGCPP